MEVAIPGIRFLVSSIPLEFETDGCKTVLQPVNCHSGIGHVLVLTEPHVRLFGLESVRGVSLYDSINLPDQFKAPEMYDGTQEIGGKRILVLMLNGWGDVILIQPALQALHSKASLSGRRPHITLACNWIHNFPYRGVPYVEKLIPNILTLKEFTNYDFLINLIPLNYQKSRCQSLKELCLDMFRLDTTVFCDSPHINPDPVRLERIRPVLEEIRISSGKKLLCVNWKSRFKHKDASPDLFSGITNELAGEYQALLFKDGPTARAMQKEIEDFRMPVINLADSVTDYHDTIAALSLIDAFVSVDTGIVHAAGAMDIPGVVLFGPFPPETHVADYKSVIGIRAPYHGNACSGPCLETHRGCAEVEYASDVLSPCFEAIEPDAVVAALKRLLLTVDRSPTKSFTTNRVQVEVGLG